MCFLFLSRLRAGLSGDGFFVSCVSCFVFVGGGVSGDVYYFSVLFFFLVFVGMPIVSFFVWRFLVSVSVFVAETRQLWVLI